MAESGIKRRRVIAFIGLPGAGKSTLARAIAGALQLPRVDRDALPRAHFTEMEKAAVNARVFRAVARHACVVDGMTFARADDRRRLRHAARGKVLRWIFLACPLALAQTRVARDPAHPARDRDAALVRAVAARLRPPPRTALRLSARERPQALLRHLLRAL